MTFWAALCFGFALTLGVELALGICHVFASAFREANKK